MAGAIWVKSVSPTDTWTHWQVRKWHQRPSWNPERGHRGLPSVSGVTLNHRKEVTLHKDNRVSLQSAGPGRSTSLTPPPPRSATHIPVTTHLAMSVLTSAVYTQIFSVLFSACSFYKRLLFHNPVVGLDQWCEKQIADWAAQSLPMYNHPAIWYLTCPSQSPHASSRGLHSAQLMALELRPLLQ